MPLRWLKWPQGWVGLVLMAVLVAGCAATPEQRSTGEVIDDAAITTKVKTNLLADPVVSGFAISVETSRSVVSLTGIVNSDAERQRAIQIAQDVGGVKQVDAKNLFIKR
jgi:hyperosmotically inducible protein